MRQPVRVTTEEPPLAGRRRSRMRPVARTAAALILPLLLVGCGTGDGDHDVASDPADSTAPATASATPTPTAAPTVGTYPQFEPTDYTFELTVQCFCMPAGTPVTVTVSDAQVVGAVYGAAPAGGPGGDIKPGKPADHLFWLTINDVIAKANDTTADRVKVDWPAGQDYPNSVFVDPDKNAADEEVGYTIADVVIAPAQ
jgi:Family of unknown function (DUF6174)